MYRRLLLACLAVACTGCDFIWPSWDGGGSAVSAPTSTTTSTTTSTPTSTSTTLPPATGISAECIPTAATTFVRPYSDQAPWNVPVCGLAQDARSSDWANRLWLYSRINGQMATNPEAEPHRDKHGIMFGFDADPSTDFSVAVYDARDATGTIRVFQRHGWVGLMSINNGDRIPWNPSWKASTGSDALMVILDPDTGRHWSLWGVVQHQGGVYNDSQCWPSSLYWWMSGGGYHSGTDLCVGGADLARNASRTAVADYRTNGGNNPATRGIGIDEYAMLVTPQEVATGSIRHAMMMPVYNTMSGGTVCTASQMSTNAFGHTCGEAVAPAGNFEKAGGEWDQCNASVAAGMTADQWRATSLPEGTRMALRLSDAEIETWLNSRGYTGAQRTTAKAFAVALVNYGWFITDSTCYAADFQVSGGINPQTATAWRNLGITGHGRDLLDGLFKRDRIWTIAPPTNHCVDGVNRKTSCPANSITYP